MLAQVLSFFIKECHLKIRIEINVCVLYFDDLEILLLLRSQSTLSNKIGNAIQVFIQQFC